MKNNTVVVRGKLVDNFQFSHEAFNEKFYKNTVAVQRKSGTYDYVPVVMSEFVAEASDEWSGMFVELQGEWRTVGYYEGDHRRCLSHLFISDIYPEYELVGDEHNNGEEWINSVELIGEIMNNPNFRSTQKGDELCDFRFGVERKSGKVDVVHCIAWNRIARVLACKGVGTKMWLKGRIQSREYTKSSNGIKEIRTAYEISIINIVIAKDIEEGLD